eukprot:Rmarinus@m.18318
MAVISATPVGGFAQQGLPASQCGALAIAFGVAQKDAFPGQTTVRPPPAGGFAQQDWSASQGGITGRVAQQDASDVGNFQRVTRQPISEEKTNDCKMGEYTYFDKENGEYVLCDDYLREFSEWTKKKQNKYRWCCQGGVFVVTTIEHENCTPTTLESNARGFSQKGLVKGQVKAVRVGWIMSKADLSIFSGLDDDKKDFIVLKHLRRRYQRSIKPKKEKKAVGSPTPQPRCQDACLTSHPCPHPVSAHNPTIGAAVPPSLLPRDPTHVYSSPLHPLPV